MSGVKDFVFDPERPGGFFSVAQDGSRFDSQGVRIRRGDPVSLTAEMAEKVRGVYGPKCLRPADSVVLDGDVGVVAADKVRGLELRGEFWRLAALALGSHHNRRGEMARACGAAKNADADAQKAALLSMPAPGDIEDVVAAMRDVEQGWA